LHASLIRVSYLSFLRGGPPHSECRRYSCEDDNSLRAMNPVAWAANLWLGARLGGLHTSLWSLRGGSGGSLDGGVVVTGGTNLVARALVVLHWSSVVVVVWSWYCL
jgi:hypothetical protein